MRNRLVLVGLISFVLLWVTACGNKEAVISSNEKETISQVESLETDEAIAENSLDEKAENYEVMNGIQTEVIGERRELMIDKSAFQALSHDEIVNFLEYIDKYHGILNYYTINFGDGTGITIPGADSQTCLDWNILEYSKLDDTGSSVESIAFITNGDGYFYLSDEEGNALTDGTSPYGINGLIDGQ